MMHLVQSLIIVVALALAATEVASRDLYEHCRDMRDRMEYDENLYKDPKAALAYVTSQLRSGLSFVHPARAKLAAAFEAVVRDEDCGPASLNHLALIDDCQPHGPMDSLHKAALKYGKKCLEPKLIEERVSKAVSDSSARGLIKFMSDEVIAEYHADNPDERPIHFATIGGDNCCQPSRAGSAITKAISAKLEKEGKHAAEYFKGDQSKLEGYLRRHFFGPCRSYVSATRKVMWALYAASDYYPGSDQFRMLGALSQQAQNAVFRYKLCDNLEYTSRQRVLLAAVAPNFV